jgi:hypothetical protein
MLCANISPWRLQKEASDVFFAATKLFQAKDPHLRRMVYLLIKVMQLQHGMGWGGTYLVAS